MPRRMPDGVMKPETVAASVSADLKRKTAGERTGERRRRAPMPPGWSGTPKRSKEFQSRAALLTAVRRGDAGAIKELRAVHHAWIIPGPGKGA